MPKRRRRGVDVLELGVPIRVGRPFQGLVQRLEPIPEVMQQPSTVVALTCHPCAVNAAASFALLLHVQRNGEVGSRRITGSTSASSAALSPGCAVSILGRPAPGRRSRPAGAPPSANSRRPLRIVVRDKPVADDTTASPP